MTLSATIALCTALQAFCALLDMLLLKRERRQFHDQLIYFWNRLDDLRTPNLPIAAANLLAPLFRLIIGPRLASPRAFVVALIWCTLAAAIGYIAYGLIYLGPENTKALWLTGPWKAYLYGFIFSNAVTAIPSFLVTAWMIFGAETASPKQMAWRLFVGFSASIFLGLLNAVLNGRISGSGAFLGWNEFFVPIVYMTRFLRGTMDEVLASHIAISMASFMADFMLLTVIGLLVTAKGMLLVSKAIAMRMLETTSEKSAESLAPFSILAIFVNILIALIKLLQEFLR